MHLRYSLYVLIETSFRDSAAVHMAQFNHGLCFIRVDELTTSHDQGAQCQPNLSKASTTSDLSFCQKKYSVFFRTSGQSNCASHHESKPVGSQKSCNSEVAVEFTIQRKVFTGYSANPNFPYSTYFSLLHRNNLAFNSQATV